MNRESKTILSWVFFVVGIFILAVVFNTIGLILGLQVREKGGSSAPAIANGIALGVWAVSMLFLF